MRAVSLLLVVLLGAAGVADAQQGNAFTRFLCRIKGINNCKWDVAAN